MYLIFIVVSGGEHVDVMIGAVVADGKVESLIKILLKYQHTEDFRAVFAELPSLGFIRCASLIGHNNSQEMHDTIVKFRDGRVTLLVAPSVAEEGLDIRQNLSHVIFLRNARNSEETLRKEAIERTDLSLLKDTSRLILRDTVPLLLAFRYSILRPEFIMKKHEKSGGPIEYSCQLQLPCNAPFEELEGPMCSSLCLAEHACCLAVCLAACKKLHEMGEFTDMLLLDKGSGEEAEKSVQNDDGDTLPGTARHREFYPEGVAVILQVSVLHGFEVPSIYLYLIYNLLHVHVDMQTTMYVQFFTLQPV
ncbi:hypothetical protein GQ457_15G020220 [Hibiscus cannabinus]